MPSDEKPTAERRGRATAWLLGRRALLVLSIVVGFGVLGGSVWGYRVLTALEVGKKHRLGGVLENYDSGPRNVLILGSDTREGLTKEEQERFGSEADVPDDRTDTIILMHLDPERDRAIVVHFPRDLRVRIPGEGFDKINAAYDYGGGGVEGAELAIRTVEAFSGLEINNYIEISLAGFQDLVDSLGGVRICVEQPLFDELSGLAIPSAGCHTLDGFMALAYVRARHLEGDVIPDFSRITRQQQFMRALVNRMLSLDSLLDTSVIREAARQVTTDDQLSGADLIYLASELRNVAETDPSGASLVDFRAVPATPRFINGVSYVIAEQPEARKLFTRIREGRPLGEIGTVLEGTEISEANVRTQVLRAASTVDADEVDQYLREAGFIVLPQENAPDSFRRTEILFRPGEDEMADVVAGYFPTVPVLEGPARILGDADVVVVVGPDYRSPVG